MARKLIFSFELEPGMVVFEDVFDPTGRLILPKGSPLDDETISKLNFFNIQEVPIDDEAGKEEAKPELVIPEEHINSDYTDKLKATEEYTLFSGDYKSLVTLIKRNLDDLVTNHKPVDEDAIISGIFELIKDCKTMIQVMEILHNLEPTEEQAYHHCLNVAVISLILAKWLRLPKDEQRKIVLAGVLHDVGKLTIPTEVLNKTGRLTDEEFALIKSHVRRGYDIIRDLDYDVKIKEAVLLHHERCDGSGYPFKVTGDKISSYAKIIAVADVYDAMTSARTYRKGLSPFDVIKIFENEGLYKYDPQYVMTFLENIVSSYLHNNVLLSDGRVGEIIMINSTCLYRPIIKVGPQEFVNLISSPDLTIEALV